MGRLNVDGIIERTSCQNKECWSINSIQYFRVVGTLPHIVWKAKHFLVKIYMQTLHSAVNIAPFIESWLMLLQQRTLNVSLSMLCIQTVSCKVECFFQILALVVAENKKVRDVRFLFTISYYCLLRREEWSSQNALESSCRWKKPYFLAYLPGCELVFKRRRFLDLERLSVPWRRFRTVETLAQLTGRNVFLLCRKYCKRAVLEIVKIVPQLQSESRTNVLFIANGTVVLTGPYIYLDNFEI